MHGAPGPELEEGKVGFWGWGVGGGGGCAASAWPRRALLKSGPPMFQEPFKRGGGVGGAGV